MKTSLKKQGIRGFTVIELLVVVSVIGMLSAVIFASLGNARQKSLVAAGQVFSRHTYNAFNNDIIADYYFEDDGCAPPYVDRSQVKNHIANWNISSNPLCPTSADVPVSGSKSLYFSIAQQINLPNPTFVTPNPAGNLSFSFWLKATTTSISSIIAMNRSQIFVSGGAIAFSFGPGFNSCTSPAPIDNGEWHHIFINIRNDSDTATFYVDGKRVGTPCSSGPAWAPLSGQYFYLGSNASNQPFLINHLTIYNNAII